MLTEPLLQEALHAALKGAEPPCTRWCRAGAEIDGQTYRIFHNGTGSSDSAAVVIYAEKVLGLNMEQTAGRMRVWVENLHRHTPMDPNQ
jgi:hypothetical protein